MSLPRRIVRRVLQRPGAVLAGGIVLCAALLRAMFPLADPPISLSGSGGLFFDEGALAHNARNLVLFGQWRLDEWNSYLYSPPLYFLQVAAFYLFGVGFIQERLISMLLGTASVYLLYRFASEAWGREAGLYSAVFLGTSYYAIMYSRIGLLETPYTFAMVLTIFLWQRARSRHPAYYLAAGAGAAFVFVWKALALYFVAAFVATLVLDVALHRGSERRRAALGIVWGGLGIGLVLAAWYVWFFLPNHEDIARIGEAWKRVSFPRSYSQVLRNLHDNAFFSYYRLEPVALLLAWMGGGWMVAKAIRQRPGKVDMGAWFALLWLVAGILALGFLSYRPPRYYVPLAPAVAALAGLSLSAFRASEAADPGSRRSRIAWMFGWAWATLGVRYMVAVPLVYNWGVAPLRPWGIQWLFAALLGAVVMVVLRRVQGMDERWRTRWARSTLVAGVLLASLVLDARHYAFWAKNRQYTMVHTSRELADVVGDGYVAGLQAPALSLENRAKVLYAWKGFFNFEDPFGQYPITHLILAVYNGEVEWYWHEFPEWMERAHLIRVHRLWRSAYYMFSMNEADRGIFNRLRKDRGGALDAELVDASSPAKVAVGSVAKGWVRVRNTGKELWTREGRVALGVYGDRNPLGDHRLRLDPGEEIRPGETKTFEVSYRAPRRPRYYAVEWRMVKDGVAWFGDSLPVGIQVIP